MSEKMQKAKICRIPPPLKETLKCANCGKEIVHEDVALHYWDYTEKPKEVWFCNEECLEEYNFGRIRKEKEAKP